MTDSLNEKHVTLFRNIDADDEDPEVTEIESFCVNCEKQVDGSLYLPKRPELPERPRNTGKTIRFYLMTCILGYFLWF